MHESKTDKKQVEVLALIPARSGSKGIPNKNVRPFRGIPMLAHSIRHAHESSLVTRTIISTDSPQYADIARQFGGEVPFLRPAAIADDLSTDLEVFQHALDWLKQEENYQPEICVHLRPTYPTRNSSDIDAIVRLLLETPALDSVRSVTPASHSPYKMWCRKENNLLQPVIQTSIREAHSLPRQSLPVVYLQNACIDAIRRRVIQESQSMTGEQVYGYVLDHNDDIDTVSDFDEVVKKDRLSFKEITGLTGTKYRVFCIDIDGVLATIVSPDRYQDANPICNTIDKVNELFNAGHKVILFTARGSATGLDWQAETEAQLRSWGVKYHRLMFGKPAADFYVDDKAMLPEELRELASSLIADIDDRTLD
jgi:CMP-N,N'-diacetyllegionaminic acid synthase